MALHLPHQFIGLPRFAAWSWPRSKSLTLVKLIFKKNCHNLTPSTTYLERVIWFVNGSWPRSKLLTLMKLIFTINIVTIWPPSPNILFQEKVQQLFSKHQTSISSLGGLLQYVHCNVFFWWEERAGCIGGFIAYSYITSLHYQTTFNIFQRGFWYLWVKLSYSATFCG